MSGRTWLIIWVFLVGMVSNAAGRTIYVDNDGPADFNNIQAAINASIDGDIIIVSSGTYTGPGNRDIDFNAKAITIRSTDPNDPNIVAATIIDCQGSDDEPYRGFYFHSGEDANSILAGITITNGYADGSYSVESRGGGIYCEDSSPRISNCIFTGNSADEDGGGMCNYDSRPTVEGCTFNGNWSQDGGGMCNYGHSSPIVEGCTFSENSALYGGGMNNKHYSSPTVNDCIFSFNSARRSGGGMYNEQSNPTVTNCTFSENSANDYGGGMYNRYCRPSVEDCTFSENSAMYDGGGMYNRYSSPTVEGCTFSENSAMYDGGGMYNKQSSPTVEGCTFSENSARYNNGGGMANDQSSPTVAHCTFTGNSADGGGGMGNYGYSSPTVTNCTFGGNSATYGGGMDSGSSSPTVTNCILWADVPSEIEIRGGTPTVRYSDVQGGWPGEGNIDADPSFVQPGYWDANGVWVEGDYHLLAGSPCINTGDPNYVAEPNETDLDGRPRVIGGRIDMGTYEYSPPIPVEVRIVPRTINLASKGKWISCYIWLPEVYNVADIDPNSILLEDEIGAESFQVDEDQQIAVARFSRSEVQDILAPGEVELTVSGELTDGTRFEGTDTIRVIDKGGGGKIKD